MTLNPFKFISMKITFQNYLGSSSCFLFDFHFYFYEIQRSCPTIKQKLKNKKSKFDWLLIWLIHFYWLNTFNLKYNISTLKTEQNHMAIIRLKLHRSCLAIDLSKSARP